jgi:HlyD family secretion protein
MAMTKHKTVLASLLIIILAAVVYWVYINTREETAFIRASGSIEATTVDITSRTYGIIESLKLEEGNRIEKGQLVAQISRDDLVAQRERDAMAVQSAQDQLSDLQSGARQPEIDAAQAEVNIAQAAYDKASQDYNRMQTLYDEGAIAKEQLEQALLNRESKMNQYNAAVARLNLLISGNRPAQIDKAAAEVQKSQAVLKSTEALLDDLKIYSPLSGTVLSRNYEEGEYVTAGAPLATIADLTRLWIKVYIPTDDLPAIKLGDQVHFTVSGDKTNYRGVVKQIASQGEYTPKTIQTQKERTNVVYAVKIEIENANGRLKPGMPADVIFDGSAAHD